MLVVMKLSADTLQEIEPNDLAVAIRSNMDWGPMNSETAVRANFHCEYCDTCLLDSVVFYYSWELDHITPGAGDGPENLALSCRTCNHLKHVYPPIGSTREERILDARCRIDAKREVKNQELARLKDVIAQYHDF